MNKSKNKVVNIKINKNPLEKGFYRKFTTKGNPQPLDPIDDNDPRNYKWTVEPFEVWQWIESIINSEGK